MAMEGNEVCMQVRLHYWSRTSKHGGQAENEKVQVYLSVDQA